MVMDQIYAKCAGSERIDPFTGFDLQFCEGQEEKNRSSICGKTVHGKKEVLIFCKNGIFHAKQLKRQNRQQHEHVKEEKKPKTLLPFFKQWDGETL